MPKILYIVCFACPPLAPSPAQCLEGQKVDVLM